MRKHLNEITFFLFTLCITVILWLTWVQKGVLRSDTITVVIAIFVLIYFMIDCNCWILAMRGFTHGLISLIHIWAFVLYFHFMSFMDLLIVTIIFLYIRDEYLKKKGI